MNMEGVISRCSTVFTTFVVVLGTAALGCHLSSYFYDPQPLAQITFRKVNDFTPNSFLNCDQANLQFDLDVDLTSEFHWNQSQLFLYLVASYVSDTNQ